MYERYICEWQGPDNPTIGMSEKDAAKYWKDHNVAGDCRFALRPGGHIPDDLRVRWAMLQGAIVAKGGRETPTHRRERDDIKHAWRQWIGTMPLPPLTVIPDSRPGDWPDEKITIGGGQTIAA